VECVRVMRTLLECGADPNAVDSAGQSALECAFLEEGELDVVELMLAKGGRVTRRMLEEGGRPRGDVRGILRRWEWMKRSCYTEEAWEAARPHLKRWGMVELDEQMGKEREVEILEEEEKMSEVEHAENTTGKEEDIKGETLKLGFEWLVAFDLLYAWMLWMSFYALLTSWSLRVRKSVQNILKA